MNRREDILEQNAIARKIVEILEDHKAEDIVLLDVSKQIDIADFFVIANGTSDRMIDSLANFVVDGVRDEFHVHGSVQGTPNGGWTLIDFGNVIVNIFSPDRRAYYSLEDLFRESKVLLRVE